MPVTLLSLLLLFFAAPLAVNAGSARIELPVASRIIAEAEYWPGEAGLPAVLIVHGFLQTHDFSTVRRLAGALADHGFSVLTPSLSLGFNRRRQGVACEALHVHSMGQDIAELRAWTEWLAERSGTPPVLIGHGAGGVQLSAMLDANPHLNVERALLISLSSFNEELRAEEFAAIKARATADALDPGARMRRYALSYCGTYVTTPAKLLSYLRWDRDHLTRALVNSAVPITVVYGGRDSYIDRAWLAGLQSGGVAVRQVAGANHFFDLAHETDLLNEVLRLLAEARHG